jgi:hypothetical protein
MKTLPKGPFLGINTRKPDYALHVPKQGDYLRDALNVDVDNAGTLRRRKAEELVQAMTDAHSLHMTSDTTGYVVRGSTIYAITLPAYSETLFKVLSNDNPVSWLEWNGDLYYSNGTDSGRIRSGGWYPQALPTPASPAATTISGGLLAGKYQIAVSQYNATTGEEGGVSASSNYELSTAGGLRVTLPALATGATHILVYISTANGAIPKLHGQSATGGVAYDITVDAAGREANQRYEAPLPAGWLFLFNGCLCSYNGANVYEGLPFRPGYYLPSEGRIPFPATVSNCVPAQAGVYVVADKTYWISGPRITTSEMVQDVLPYGGVPHTEFSVPNRSLYGWFSAQGFVLGSPSGEVEAVMSDNIKLTAPATGVSAVIESTEYRRVVSCGWCMNLDTKAATRYDYTFTSISRGYGTKADGLYLLEGTGTVAWSINFGKENFGTEEKKRLPAVYLGCTSERPLRVRVRTPKDDYIYTARSCSDELQEHRVDPGKGLKANWFELSLEEEDCDFTLATASFAPVASTRRI